MPGHYDPLAFGQYDSPAKPYSGDYTRQSLYVPMRDGVQLAVTVHLPVDRQSGDRLPTLLQQTRYWRAIELKPPFKWFLDPDKLDPLWAGFKPFFISRGYALVNVDVRGTGASFGSWPYPWGAQSIEDAYDIVTWIVAQPWSDGAVGGMGTSYLGTSAELLAACGHPAVKAIVPRANHPDAYLDITMPGGVYNRHFMQDWGDVDEALDHNQLPPLYPALAKLLTAGVLPVDGPDGRAQLAAALRDHAANNHAYDISAGVTYRDDVGNIGISIDELAVHQHADAIRASGAAFLGMASWLDAGTADAAIRRFLTYQGTGRVIIGAWDHSGARHASPYQPPGTPLNPPLPAVWAEQLRFFDRNLRGSATGAPHEKSITFYTLRAERWQQAETFPPPGTRMVRWYMAADGALSPDAPQNDDGADTYTVDWAATTGPLNRWWELHTIQKGTVVYNDRRAAAEHLLTYLTPRFTQDTEITGYPVVTLYVTSTHDDGAFFVYLEDVDPSGNVTYITDGQLRALHRKVAPLEQSPYTLLVPYHTFKQADAQPLVPGEVAEITFGLQPTSVLIRQGHRLRVGIAGHDADTFTRIPADDTPTIMVQRNHVHASWIDLPVVGR